MDLLDIRCISAAAETGNLSQAATLLGLDIATVSRRIGRSEDEIGVTLFERSRKGVRLTTAGKAVLVHAKRALIEVDAMTHVARERASGIVGELRLGVSVPPMGGRSRELLTAWLTAHPEIALTTIEGSRRELAAALNARRVDVVLFGNPANWPGVATQPLFRERLLAGIPLEHPLVSQSMLHWVDLSPETVLVQGWEDAHTQREFYATMLGNGARFQTHAASRHTIFALIGAGAGITLAPEGLAEATYPGVVFRPIDEDNAWLDFGLVWLAETEDPVVGRFVAFMRDRARNLNSPAAA